MLSEGDFILYKNEKMCVLKISLLFITLKKIAPTEKEPLILLITKLALNELQRIG